MKKLSIIIILILGATFIIMPTIVGRVAELATIKLLDKLNTASSKYGELTIVDYQRGFRETKSNFSWKANGGIIKPITIDCVGKHGVFSYSHLCSVSSNDFHTLETGTQSPITLAGKSSLFGKASETITFNKFQLNQSDDGLVSILPSKFVFSSDDGLVNFDMKATSEGFTLASQNQKIIFSNLDMNGSGALNVFKFIIGDISASSDFVSYESVGNEKFIFEGFTMYTSTKEDRQDISLEHKLKANNYLYTKAENVKLNNLDLEFKLSGVDMAQLALFNEKIESISNNAKSQTNASYIRLIPVFQDLLKTNLSATAKLFANDLSDQITVDANFKLVDGLSFGDVLMLKLNPKSVFSKVIVNYDSTIPQSLLNKNLPQLNVIADNGWYVKKDDGVSSRFNMQDGEAILNGKQLSMDEMLAIIGM